MSDYKMKLAAGRLAATRAAPYYSHALLSLVPVIVPTGTLCPPGVPPEIWQGTAATTDDYILLVEEGALDRWTAKQCAGVMVHEVSHNLRHHHKRRGDRDPQLSNDCEDAEINDDLAAMGLELPDGGGIQPATLGLPAGKTFEWYYEQLPKQQQKKQPRYCGSCAGNPHPGEDKAVPGDVPRKTKAEQAQIAAATAHAVREHVQKRQGNVPAGVRVWAEVHGTPPEVSWQDQLTRACRRAVFYRPGAIDFKYNRPSRRQAGIGYGPGRAVLPAMVSPVPQIAVMFDTSGSMVCGSPELVKSAARETEGVLRAMNAKVRLCVVDAKVHAMQDVTTIDQVLKLLSGGGGTDFREAFKQLEESKPRPEVIVVMTDGYASVPDVAPSARVIWCLVGRDVNEHPATWGDVVRVK